MVTQNPGLQERTLWKEFHDQPNTLIPESEEKLRQTFGVDDNSDLETSLVDGICVRPRIGVHPATEVWILTKQRCGQEYFRDRVLNNYGSRCGMTGLAVRELLVASHILPWSTHPANRLDVRNGLCLSRLIDAAFDQHLMAFDAQLRLILSPRLQRLSNDPVVAEQLGRYIGKPLQLPANAQTPNANFLAEHRAITLQIR